jgi:hypothetical protein
MTLLLQVIDQINDRSCLFCMVGIGVLTAHEGKNNTGHCALKVRGK